MTNNKLTNTEKAFQDKLNEVSFNFKAEDWKNIQSKIKKPSFWNLYKYYIAVSAVFLVGSIITAYFLNSDSSISVDKSKASQTEINSTKVNKGSLNNNQPIINEVNTSIENTKPSLIPKIEEPEQQIVEEIIKDSNVDTNLDTSKSESNTFVKEPITVSHIQELIITGKPCLGEIIEIKAIIDDYSENEVLTWKVNGVIQSTTIDILQYEIKEFGAIQITCENEEYAKSTELYVESLPEIDFTYEDLVDPFWDEAVKLTAAPLNLDYSWEIEGIEDKIKGNNQTIELAEFGIYDVELSHLNSDECLIKVSKPISIQRDFDPLAPSHFSPNGDLTNDDFIPQGFFNVEGLFKFSIYSSEGKLIYQTNSKDAPWNGGINNSGQKFESGTFVWKVEIDNNERKKVFMNFIKIYNN